MVREDVFLKKKAVNYMYGVIDALFIFCLSTFSVMWTLMTANTMMIRCTEKTTVFTTQTDIPSQRLPQPATQRKCQTNKQNNQKTLNIKTD